MLGKLTWDAIPFDEPIPLVVSGILVLAILGVLGLDHGEGPLAVSVARMDHQRRS